MQFRYLQNHILMVMISSALILSMLFSTLAYQLNQSRALEESEKQVRTLMAAVKNTASAALFSG